MPMIHIHKATGKPFLRGAKASSRSHLCGAMPFRPRRKRGAYPAFYFRFPKRKDMWGNATYGCCVTTEEAFNKALAGIFVNATVVVQWASQNGDLNGANLQPVIQQMQQSGFSQDGNIYGDGSALSVAFADAPTMQAAIYEAGTNNPGGGVKFGVAADALPSGAGNQDGWVLTGASPDSNEDHCMGCCGYGTVQQFITAINAEYGLNLTVPAGVNPTTQGYAVFTWSTIGFFDVKTWNNIVGEAWIRQPNTTINGNGTPTPDSVSVYTSSTPTPTPGPGPNPVPTPNPTPTPVPNWFWNAIQLIIQFLVGLLATKNIPIEARRRFAASFKGRVQATLAKRPGLRAKLVTHRRVKGKLGLDPTIVQTVIAIVNDAINGLAPDFPSIGPILVQNIPLIDLALTTILGLIP